MEQELLLQVLDEARRRLASRRAWRQAGRFALAWAAAALAAVLARTVVPFEVPVLAVLAAGLAAAVAARLALRILRRPSHLVAAQILDLRFDCADRLATAVELMAGRHPPTALGPAVLADAAAHAAVIDLRRGLPAGPDRAVAAAVALAAAAAVAGSVLTGYSLPGTPARQVAETIQREGRRLERAGAAIEEQARAQRARASRRIAPEVKRLGQALQRERLGRGDALARIESLGRQIEAERRQVRLHWAQAAGERPQPEPALPSELFRRRAGADRALRKIREIAEQLARSQSPEDREALMRQLAALAGGGEEGDVPVGARQHAEAARRRLAAGDTSGAQRALQQAGMDLDEIRAMLADEEGLQQAQRDLDRSAARIAGRMGPDAEPEQAPRAAAQPGTAAPGRLPPPQGAGPDQEEPPPGPHQGTAPGQGAISEKLGARTPRLETERQMTRVAGLQGEGRVRTSDIPGPGRPAQITVPAGPAVAAARSGADRYMSRMRIPPEYREIVRRYFEALAASR